MSPDPVADPVGAARAPGTPNMPVSPPLPVYAPPPSFGGYQVRPPLTPAQGAQIHADGPSVHPLQLAAVAPVAAPMPAPVAAVAPTPPADAPISSTNPKKAAGGVKPSMHFIPPVAMLEEARVMALGASKYGPFNWQDQPIDSTTYYDAMMRHLMQWFTGEEVDAESGASHLAHVRACCGILIDAKSTGSLIDDRPAKVGKASIAIAAHVAKAA